jgi:hypothetical protein
VLPAAPNRQKPRQQHLAVAHPLQDRQAVQGLQEQQQLMHMAVLQMVQQQQQP